MTRELGLSEEVTQRVIHMWKTGPVREPCTTRAVTGRFFSRIMGDCIPFGSRTCELSFLREAHDPASETCLVLAEPLVTKVTCNVKCGALVAKSNYTPDYFVLSPKWTGCVQCKWENEIEWILNPANPKSKPGYFVKRNGIWTAPPCDQAIEALGMKHKMFVMTSDQITMMNNLEFLEDYFDEPKGNYHLIAEKRILAMVAHNPGIPLCEVRDQLPIEERDTLFFMIAQRSLFADIDKEPICPNYRVPLYTNKATFHLSGLFQLETAANDHPQSFISIRAGTELRLDSEPCRITTVAANLITLEKGGARVDMLVSELERMLKKGRITPEKNAPSNGLREAAENILRKMDPADWDAIYEKHLVIQPYLNAHTAYERKKLPPKTRTVFRYLENYRKAQVEFGSDYGILGLREKPRPGNAGSKLEKTVVQIINAVIDERFIKKEKITKELVWGEVQRRCQNHKPSLSPPGRKSVMRQIKLRSKNSIRRAQEGEKAASVYDGAVWDDASDGLSFEGESAWGVVHIDHTQHDCETEKTADDLSLGRPWHTVMVSPRFRRFLAVVSSYEPPSYRSCLAVLRECVRRHGRLPSIVVTDGGREFRSSYFRVMCKTFGISHAFRPPRKPRWGSVLERLNLTINTQLLHNLPGNTKLMKDPRRVSASHSPKRLARLSLSQLADLLEAYCYKTVDTRANLTTGISPRSAFESAQTAGGPRSHKIIFYDENFLLTTMPSTKTGHATISNRQGVTINYLPYWCSEMKLEKNHGKSVPIKYDPFDCSRAWVHIDNEWIHCKNREFSYNFKGLSEREIKTASIYLHGAARTFREKRRAVNAVTLASFFHKHVWTLEGKRDRARAEANQLARSDKRRGTKPPRQQPPPPSQPTEWSIFPPKTTSLQSSGLKGYSE